ncbi:MAG: hypothetical protein AUI15_26910 [Actinobacteria bacterium 13_2_20CM_2_66_6]|nr:MAG: hypothetical protein AUI15_26910 [Actinobacteria bacterium 13_2_20CM_2_66_6]
MLMRRLMSELCRAFPSNVKGGTTSTSWPCSRSHAALPLRWLPKAKSKPMTQCLMSIREPSISMNSCGPRLASARSNLSTMACSTPAASSSASFSCSVVID